MYRFWDIECYDNLFCVGFLDDNDHLDMFYLCDQPEEVDRACRDSGYDYTCYNLVDNGTRLQEFMENPIPSNGEATLLSEFLGTANKVVKPKEDWYFAYNCINYDIPMIDYVVKSMVSGRTRVSTEALRKYSNTVITATRSVINTTPYVRYGNHVDVAFLNETKIEGGRPTVGLKTLVGILGGSIIESESNKTGHSKSIYSDILYNINDIAELKHTVFPGFLANKFKIKKNLLEKYPHLKDCGVTVNSTSAKFVEFIIAPDKQIEDTPTVTYLYPAKHKAKELDVKQKDMLEDTWNWYMENVFGQIRKTNPKAAANHLAKFASIYQYYDSFRGKNWNESTNHVFAHGIPAQTKLERKRADRTYGVILPFIDKYGRESSSYVRFSIGGIHGAEINQRQLDQDRAKIRELKEKYGYISKLPKKACSKALLNLIIAQSRTSYKNHPVRCSHEIPHFFQNTEPVDEILDPEDFSPYMCQKAKHFEGIYDYQEELLDRYKYTSSGYSVHQDFVSYYPLLMIMLGTFHDGQGKDPYEEVKDSRVAIKAMLKVYEFGTKQWDDTNNEQEGYKLILNSASGILDGSHDTNLRANNKAIAMRSIGQMCTFRIGMALALEGATIPSSNTDGIYALNISLDRNKEIVEKELKSLYIDIDPEEMYLVSKDANNRMEIVDGKVTSARGGTLTSWKGARVDNSLSHPALVDRILTDYLQDADLMGPVDLDSIRKHLHNYVKTVDRQKFVYMSSWVMRSTSGSIFVDSDNQVHKGTVRVWLSQNGVSFTRYNTRAQKIGDTTEEYAKVLFDDSPFGKPEIVQYLSGIGALEDAFPKAITTGQYKQIRMETPNKTVPVISDTKIPSLSDTARLYVNNACINEMTEVEINRIYENIDLEEYVALIGTFALTWHNHLLAS
jgi:hypothetical protein